MPAGGLWRIHRLRRVLEVLADPEHDEYDSMLEWVGGGFDAEHFDLAAVNESLSFIADRRQR